MRPSGDGEPVPAGRGGAGPAPGLATWPGKAGHGGVHRVAGRGKAGHAGVHRPHLAAAALLQTLLELLHLDQSALSPDGLPLT